MISNRFMRIVDRWVGIPTCLVFSLINRVVWSWRGQTVRDYRRIAFISLAEIGAIVLTQPAITAARQRYPDAEIFFITGPQGIAILRLMGFSDHQILVIDTTSILQFAKTNLSCIYRMRRLKLDATINIEVFIRYSTLISWLGGAPVRVGFHKFHNEGGYVGNLNTHRLIYSPHQHITRSYVALVEALSEGKSDEPASRLHVEFGRNTYLRLPSDHSTLARVERLLEHRFGQSVEGRRLVLLNPNASDMIPVRRWPASHFVSLARHLLTDLDVLIALTGTDEDVQRVADLASEIGSDRVVSIAGATTIAELVELFHIAALLITNDSGPAHIASTTKIPTLVLFGPETPEIFGPTGDNQLPLYLGLACSPCVSPHNQKRSPCSNNRCMREIRPDMVYAHARRYLAKSV